MLRKIGYTLLCAAAAFTTNAYSMVHNLQVGITLEYFLPPNEPQEFANTWFWPVTANCLMTTTDDSNLLFVEALKKNGAINDVPMSEGESREITIQNSENLKIKADSGAKVKITNKGDHVVKASCSSAA
jgi:hypothetical protein